MEQTDYYLSPCRLLNNCMKIAGKQRWLFIFLSLLFGMLFLGVGNLKAGHIKESSSIELVGTGSDSNKGDYMEFKVFYYYGDGKHDVVKKASLRMFTYGDGAIDRVAFNISGTVQRGASGYYCHITANTADGFYVEALPEYIYTDKNATKNWSVCGTSTYIWDKCDASARCYVRVYLPNGYQNRTNIYWKYEITEGQDIKLPHTVSGSKPGSISSFAKFVSASAELDPSTGTYDVSYEFDSYIGTVTPTNVILSVGSYSTTHKASKIGKFSTSSSWLRALEPTRNATVKLSRIYETSKIEHSTTTYVELPHLRVPKSLSVTDNNDGSLKLGWTIDDAATKNTAPYNSSFVLSVKNANIDGGKWRDLNITVPYHGDISNYEYKYELPKELLDKGMQDWAFAVRRSCINFSEGLMNYNTWNPAFIKAHTSSIQTNYERPDAISFDEASKKLYIKTLPGIKLSNLTHYVSGSAKGSPISNLGVAKIVPDTDPKRKEGYTYYIESNIENCTPSIYTVQTKIGNSEISGYVKSTNEFVYSPKPNAEILEFSASKGYYNDRVDLLWKVDPLKNDFHAFILDRYLVSAGGKEVKKQVAYLINDGKQTEFRVSDDNSSGGLPPVPGTYYRYELTGTITCDTTTSQTNSLTDIGFAEALGAVSGQITYGTNSAVADVDVIFTNADIDELNPQGQNSAIDFGSVNDTAYLTVPTPYMKENPPITIQMWVKLRQQKPAGQKHRLFLGYNVTSVKETPRLNIWIDENQNLAVEFFGSKTFTKILTEEEFPLNEYFQLTAVVTQDKEGKGLYTLTPYLNGRKLNDLTMPYAVAEGSTLAFTNARISDYTELGKIDGLVDEVRIWDRVLSDNEIRTNYNRYVSVKTSRGLKAYYRFNESDLVGNICFDSSFNTDFEIYNENHGTSVNSRHNVIDIPSAEQLAFKVQTDESGNYNSGLMLPYKNSGTAYSITPVMGIHEFSPNNKNRIISATSNIINGVDFADVSSFPVALTVKYANSTYPVDSVSVSIDGMVASRDGKPLMTNAFGQVTIDVPIGNHFITVSKPGHDFVDGGRFPANKEEKYNFQTSINGLEFSDSTTVRLVGRVAGGQPETDKQLGFGLSSANVGKATVTLKTVNDQYRLNLTDGDSTIINTVGGKENTMTYKKVTTGSLIEIETNPETGEFLAILPPVPFVLAGVKTLDFEDTGAEGDEVDFRVNKSMFNINPLMLKTTEYIDPISKEAMNFVYHDSVKITRYNPAVITVEDKDAEKGAFGDSIYIHKNSITEKEDTVRLYTTLNNVVDYALGVPVLTQKKMTYAWSVEAYEEYVNRDGKEAVYSKVPLADKEVFCANALAAERLEFDLNTYEETDREESNTTLILDSLGMRDYKFKVSFPNMAGDHQLAAKLSLDVNGKTYAWEKKAILLGQLPSDGNNFVTQGPDHVDFVLRDPPGSNSYAYIEKGSVFTNTTSHTNILTENATVEMTMHFGVTSDMIAGVVVMVMNSIENKLDIETNIEQEYEWTTSNEQTNTFTFNQQITTSDDPNYIGSMADVYVGRGTNLVYGLVNQLALYPTIDKPIEVQAPNTVGDYSLFNKAINTLGLEFGTMFSYTQTHLLGHQIPQWKKLRNDLIIPVTTLPDITEINWEGDKVKYVSTLPKNDPKFGADMTYTVYYAPHIKDNDQVDKVLEYNTTITNWEERIKENEGAKIAMFDARAEYEKDSGSSAKDAWSNKKIFENISYDAGVSIEKSLEVNYEKVESMQHMVALGGSVGVRGGATINKLSMAPEIHATFGAKSQYEHGSGSTEGNSMKFGYALSEDESVLFAGKDALSVDVYGPMSDAMKSIVAGSKIPNLSGYTFRTRAGQTSCPHEPADSTIFYTDGKDKPYLLNYGTFQIEKPELMINGLRDTATVDNTAAGREATFQLQMSNISEAGMDVTYQIYPNNGTNPDGLILSLDGQPLVAARQIRIPYGQTLTKTLKVRQSALDILDYRGVGIRLGSVCDIDTYSETFINLKFIPSSTDIKLTASSKLANREALEKNGKITFKMSEYDRTFRNFGCIRLQYRNVTSENWMPLKEYVNDPKLYPLEGDRELIETPSLTYEFAYNEITPSEGEYEFRALAVSLIGTEEVTTSSDIIRVVKDVRNPQILGNPTPANGILNAGNEISITFNEDIQSGKLDDKVNQAGSNFYITGILNADQRAEPTTGLSFDGTGAAYTELPIYANGSFSIEGWVKRPQALAGTVFAYGEGSEYISLDFDATGHAVVRIGNETKTSLETINPSEVWKYIGLSYDREKKTVTVCVLQDEDPKNLFLMNGVSFAKTPATQGKLYVGNSAANNSGFKGAIGFLHFYGTTKGLAEFAKSKNETKSGTEPNLIGFWELEEGEGNVAKDKARSRHLTLSTPWYVYPSGKSLAFGGTNQYASIESNEFSFISYDDFTWEFWFKGSEQGGATTLLSANKTAYVGFDANKQLILTTEKGTQTLATSNLLDNKWHHFALSVKRNGQTKAIIDAKVTANFDSNLFGGTIGGDKYYLGAKYTWNESAQMGTYSEYFNGNIDELRIWNSALTTDGILLEKNHKLRGTEAGLKAYYPFESYQKRDQLINVYESFADMVTGKSIGNMSSASDVAPPMKDVRPVSNVSFNFTASDRKIVLNLTEEDYRIEGVTLTITAKDILDMHDNTSAPVTWLAYINRNALKWSTENVNLTMEQGEQKNFKATISNNGGENIPYYIESIPDWLTLSNSTGSLKPLESKELTFNVFQGVNIGSYEASIVLTTTNGVREILPVCLKVTGMRPDWSVNPSDFESSMSIIGQIKVDGAFQEDEEDILAAFIGDMCVGISSPQYIKSNNIYYVFADIYGNSIHNNRAVSFKLWDASTGRIYPKMETSVGEIKFSPWSMTGSMNQPVIFNALNIAEQIISVNKGWTWMSSNVRSNSPSILDQMKNALSANGTLIKGRNVYLQQPNWKGTLNEISEKNLYMINAIQAQTIMLEGEPANPQASPIKVNQGWNWIGYVPSFSLPVNDALAGFNAQEGDQIKAQVGYAIYLNNDGWVGSLTYMQPNKGYMYNSTYPQEQTLIYPSIASTNRASLRSIQSLITPKWTHNPMQYATNMTMTAVLLEGDEELRSDELEIGVFSGNECRGSALLQRVEFNNESRHLAFLMVYGNMSDKLTFKVYDHATGKEHKATSSIQQFASDGVYGSPVDPEIIITSKSPVGIENTLFKDLSVYPNPVKNKLFIQHNLSKLDILEVIDINGQVLVQEFDFTKESLDLSHLAQGVYLLRVVADGEMKKIKLIKK